MSQGKVSTERRERQSLSATAAGKAQAVFPIPASFILPPPSVLFWQSDKSRITTERRTMEGGREGRRRKERKGEGREGKGQTKKEKEEKIEKGEKGGEES